MRPRDVNDTARLLHMESDNHPGEPDVWGILHSGRHVTLHAPHGGSWVEIPKDQFDAIVDWYMADQPVRDEEAA